MNDLELLYQLTKLTGDSQKSQKHKYFRSRNQHKSHPTGKVEIKKNVSTDFSFLLDASRF